MNSQIRLTPADIEVAVNAILDLTKPDVTTNRGRERYLRHAVAAINEFRTGATLGEVRRCDYGNGTCAVAVRVRDDEGVHFWRVTHPNGGVDTFESDDIGPAWKLVASGVSA